MEDHVLSIEKEKMSPVIPIVTAGLFLLFVLGFAYRIAVFLV